MFKTPIHHVGIIVSNLEKSLYFYRDILGWKILFQDTLSVTNASELLGVPEVEGRTVILQKDIGIVNGMIEILEISKPKRGMPKTEGGFNTVGLGFLSFVVNNIDQTYNYLIDKGVTFINSPKQLDFDKYSIKSCVFFDPDGVRIEIIEFLETK